MHRLSNRIIHKLALPLLVVLVLLLVVFLVLPIRNDILDLRQAIIEERIELERYYLSGQVLKKVYTQLEKIESDLPIVEAAILKPGDELMLITTLEELAGKHDLSQNIMIDDLVLDPEAGADKVTRLPTRVSLTGRLEDLLGYLADTEVLSFYINWLTVDIKQINRQSGRGISRPNLAPGGAPVPELGSEIISFTLNGETFWR